MSPSRLLSILSTRAPRRPIALAVASFFAAGTHPSRVFLVSRVWSRISWSVSRSSSVAEPLFERRMMTSAICARTLLDSSPLFASDSAVSTSSSSSASASTACSTSWRPLEPLPAAVEPLEPLTVASTSTASVASPRVPPAEASLREEGRDPTSTVPEAIATGSTGAWISGGGAGRRSAATRYSRRRRTSSLSTARCTLSLRSVLVKLGWSAVRSTATSSPSRASNRASIISSVASVSTSRSLRALPSASAEASNPVLRPASAPDESCGVWGVWERSHATAAVSRNAAAAPRTLEWICSRRSRRSSSMNCCSRWSCSIFFWASSTLSFCVACASALFMASTGIDWRVSLIADTLSSSEIA
mmetsp:Transcript_8750/g.21661  ORF Transcript_8750/g.21661 Transcript_8750/m.21661 type:complete len:360 (+) Transcript_8750:704-1783(+)